MIDFMGTPYKELSDLTKLSKQWQKFSGLHSREEWSAAIVRAATAAEIAANLAIRHEFKDQSDLSSEFVDGLLKWANGLPGKMDRLLVPLTVNNPIKAKKLEQLRNLVDEINKRRNSIVHQGEFCNEDEAKIFIERAREFVEGLLELYAPGFPLPAASTYKTRAAKEQKSRSSS